MTPEDAKSGSTFRWFDKGSDGSRDEHVLSQVVGTFYDYDKRFVIARLYPGFL